MKQVPIISRSGMFSRFETTRVIRTVELDYNQILRAFDTLKDGEVHRMQSLALVEKAQQKVRGRLRQVNILKAVVVSDVYYEAQKLANPGVVPFIAEIKTVDDFFLPDDRFTKILGRITPKQERKESTHVIGVGGLVNIGTPFDDPSLVVDPPIVPTLVSGSAGTVTFPLINVGDIITLSYVTQALHPTLLVKRQPKQPTNLNLYIQNETHAVVMNATLAGLLGISLPPY